MTDFDDVSQQIATQDIFGIQNLVNRIVHGKVHTKNVLVEYTSVTKTILEWCGSTTPLLNELINGNNDSKSHALKLRLTTSLSDGIHKMQTSQNKITDSISSFNNISGDVVTVQIHIASEFNNKTVEFQSENRKLYENLENTVKNLYADIDNVKTQLRFEVSNIADLKVHTELTKDYLYIGENPAIEGDFHDEIIESAKRLSAECNRYHNSHE